MFLEVVLDESFVAGVKVIPDMVPKRSVRVWCVGRGLVCRVAASAGLVRCGVACLLV